jgi:signal transduction histidine kinase
MGQLWTIIFVAVLAAAFGLASWYDRQDGKRRERREDVFVGVAAEAGEPSGGAPARGMKAAGRGLTMRGVWKRIYERRWGSVEEIVTAALVRAAPLTRGHEVLTRIDEGMPAVRVDAKAVAEVVYTLVDNAAKYSPAGTRIRVRGESSDDGSVRLSVEDEGPGVPPELRERVFDKFFRAMRDGDSGTPKPSGNGMGLAIAKGITEAHGGRIWIEEAPGARGSRVVVALPIGDEEEAAGDVRELSVGVDEREAAHSGR